MIEIFLSLILGFSAPKLDFHSLSGPIVLANLPSSRAKHLPLPISTIRADGLCGFPTVVTEY